MAKNNYQSPNTVGKRQTVFIDVNDPRLKNGKYAQTLARQGAEVVVVDSTGRPVNMANLTARGNAALATTMPGVPDGPLLPPINGNPSGPYPTGSGPTIIVPTDPQNVVANWGSYTGGVFTPAVNGTQSTYGDYLQVTFDWDYANPLNVTVTQFILQLTSGGVTYTTPYNTFLANRTQTSQTLLFTPALNTAMFNIFTSSITAICIKTADPLGNVSNVICATTVPTYYLNLLPPVLGTIAALNNGYSVPYTSTTSSSFNSIDIQELESTSSTEPSGTYNRVYLGALNPVIVSTPNINQRWVKARFSSNGGDYTAFSAAQKVTPTSAVGVDLVPPNEVTLASSHWDVNNIEINFCLPDVDPGVRFRADLTAANGSTGYFYFFPQTTNIVSPTSGDLPVTTLTSYYCDGTYAYFTTNGPHTISVNDTIKVSGLSDTNFNGTYVVQSGTTTNVIKVLNTHTKTTTTDANAKITYTSHLILESDLFAQFSSQYTSFSGVLHSFDAADNRSSGVSFSVAARVNDLAALVPTFNDVAVSNGYTISYTLPSGATHAEVYQKYTSWAGLTNVTAIDSYSGTYFSGGAIGTNTVTISSVIDNDGVATTPLVGYPVSGSGIPSDSYISAIAASGSNWTLTISKWNASTGAIVASNFTAVPTALSVITATSLCYSGIGPVTIATQNYQPIYVIIKWYNDFDQESTISLEQNVTPIDPAILDTTVPSFPSVNTTSTTLNTAVISITTTDVTTKGYRIRYKKNVDTLYTTEILAPISSFVSGTSTTPYTIKGLSPSTLYDISVAGYNQYNGVGNYSTNSPATTSTQTVSLPTGATLTNAVYGLAAAWVAPASPVTPIAGYKIELYNNAAPTTVILTDTTYSTTYDFINLTVGAVYFFKVYSLDSYGGSSAAVTSSTVTVSAVSSTQATTLLTNQLFSVGGASGTYNIKIDGTGNGTTTPYKLYSGTGTYNNAGTAFYLDSVGKLSLHDKLTFNTLTASVTGATVVGSNIVYTTSTAHGFSVGSPVTITTGFTPSNFNVFNYPIIAVTTSTPFTFTVPVGASGATGTATGSGTANASLFTVNGAINAYSGNFAGAITVNGLSPSTPMKIGPNADGGTNNGIYINSNNYWYDSGNLSVGASGNGLVWDGTNFNVTGGINASRGAITGPLLIGGNGYLQASTSYTITGVTVPSSNVVTYTVGTHTIIAGNIVTIAGVIPGQYNVTNATVLASPAPTATAFSVTSSATGTYQYGGTVMVTTGAQARVQISSTSISAYDASGTATTQIISNANNGANTFITSNAKIADWAISASKIESTLVTGITKYTGLSASNTSYAFWAGATSAGNTDATAPFSVTPLGAVKASNIAIAGGNLDIGGTSVNTTLSAQAALGATALVVTSFTNIVSGMLVFGAGIPNGTTVTATPSTTSVSISAATTAIVPINTAVYFVSASGAHITSAGDLYAANANLQGKITAASGSFTGNVSIASTGSLYSGTVTPGTPPTLAGAGFILNTTGIRFNNATTQGITTIDATTGTLYTASANIGSWIVNSGSITKASAGSRGNISLDATNGYIYVSDSAVATYTAGINSANASTSVAFWAGSAITSSLPDPGKQSVSGTYDNKFVVRMDGSLFASGATIKNGTVSSSGTIGTITLDGTNDWISLAQTSNTAYIIQRNNNLYITSPSASTPWTGSTGAISSTAGPVNGPYFAAGSSFKDPYGATASGIGIYTGVWDYSTGSISAPFITATTKGLQLSAGPSIGMTLEPTTSTGNPGMLLYTALDSSYKPAGPNATTYAANIVVKPNVIGINATATAGITVASASGISLPGVVNQLPQTSVAGYIYLIANSARLNGSGNPGADGSTAYAGPSEIILSPSGVSIYGVPVAGDMDNYNNTYASNTPYLGAGSLGTLPRQRMLVENPATGQVQLGMAVYYANTLYHNTTPTTSSGYVGDLWVQY